MEIIINNDISIDQLDTLFTECFANLKDNDNNEFDDVETQAFREWFGIEYLKDYLKYGCILVAKEDEELIGASIIGMQNPLIWVDGKKYEIFALGVLPEYRNKGIGKELVLKSEEVARDNGAENIILDTHESMPATRKFYKDLGYEEIGTLESYYGNGNAVFFIKQLN
jgi:ribosomal protein S18 acetylase RimI-like enzyme